MSIKIHTTEARVEFSKVANGVISISAIENKIHLQEIKGIYRIGSQVKDDDIINKPIVELEFYSVKSIDALIEQLLEVRNNISPEPNSFQLALAC
jgi:hypothetical protein